MKNNLYILALAVASLCIGYQIGFNAGSAPLREAARIEQEKKVIQTVISALEVYQQMLTNEQVVKRKP